MLPRKVLFLTIIIIGFCFAFFFFSCSTGIAPEKSVAAHDTTIPPMENLDRLQGSFRSIAQKVLPMVVEITTVEIKTQIMPDEGDLPFFPFNFGPKNEDQGPQEREFRNQGLGSGVIVKRDGKKVYIVTNNHVIGEADEINVLLHDGRKFPAKLVGKDDRKDLALIVFETEDENIPVAEIGNSDELYVGDWVLAIGNPFGFESTVTAGIVSAKGRRGPSDNISDFIQTDASINQGNSGGALVNIKGELVGINTWITTPTGGSIGLGFAIPINNAKKAINDFIIKGAVEYGWLGVSVGDLSSAMALDMGLEKIKGGFVYHVFLNSPAGTGGILPGDFIIKINGQPIDDSNQLVLIVGDLPPGKTAVFDLIRQAERKTVEVKIGLREDAKTITENNKNLWPGIGVFPLTTDIKKEMKISEKQQGIIVREVENRTKLHLAGIKLGDIVTKINDSQINTIKDFYKVINDYNRKEFKFHFIREGNEYSLTIVR
ncbi:MAG: Do family serine endopeptidase [Spirochaetota bacterium]